MEIDIESEKLIKQLRSKEAMIKAFGFKAKKVLLRLDEISDAANLSVLQTIPAMACRQLTSNPDGQWIINVEQNLFMIFSIDQVPIPKQNGQVDTSAITKIKLNGFLGS